MSADSPAVLLDRSGSNNRLLLNRQEYTHILNFDACTPCLTECRSYRYRYTNILHSSYTVICKLNCPPLFSPCPITEHFAICKPNCKLQSFLRMDRGEEEPAEQLLWKRAISLLLERQVISQDILLVLSKQKR